MISKSERVVTCDRCRRFTTLEDARESGWDLDWENGYCECPDCVDGEDF